MQDKNNNSDAHKYFSSDSGLPSNSGKELLGKFIEAPKSYCPQILQAIPRKKSITYIEEHDATTYIGSENQESKEESKEFKKTKQQSEINTKTTKKTNSEITKEISLEFGFDLWNCYELFWIDSKIQYPIAATAVIIVPRSSLFMFESKSLKLYLNSLNSETFESKLEVEKLIKNDISNLLDCNVEVNIDILSDSKKRRIVRVPGMSLDNLPGMSLDNLNTEIQSIKANDIRTIAAPKTTNFETTAPKTTDFEAINTNASNFFPDIFSNVFSNIFYDTSKSNTSKIFGYHSNVIRSLCPVTSQPDFASAVFCSSRELSMDEIFRLRQRIKDTNDKSNFHEVCVDDFFVFFSGFFNKLNDESLLGVRFNVGSLSDNLFNKTSNFSEVPKDEFFVFAHYTRRGGIDICPYRANFDIQKRFSLFDLKFGHKFCFDMIFYFHRQ